MKDPSNENRGITKMIRTLTLIAMAFVALLTFQAPAHAAGEMKPFFLASKGAGSMEASVADATAKLQGAGFEVAGTYSPYKGATVIIVTSDALKAAAAKTEFGAYGVVQRISVTEVNVEIQVSYTNPSYMAAA